ncbi:MAG: radical SAM protein [Candidatus Omnitrophota bacterium]|jgi:hypothetical protein
MAANRILVLYLPTANQKMLPFPPLGITVLAGYLRRAGKEIRIDDIEIKYWDRNKPAMAILRPLVKRLPLRYNNPKSIFLDTPLVSAYLESNILKSRMQKILSEWEELTVEPPSTFTHVGFSVMSESQLATSLCFAKYLKEKYGLFTLLGGNFLTLRMDSLLKRYPFIDYIIAGEGEIPLDKLIGGEPLQNIENLLYRTGDCININPPATHYADSMEPDFKDLPFHLYRRESNIILPYETSKGCRNNCSFCITGRKPLYFKEPKIIADEIERFKIRHKTSCFLFVDNAINIDRKFSIQLCEEFIRRKLGIFWSAYFIPEDAPPDYFQLLKEAGCIQLRWGIETLSEAGLRKMNKQVELDSTLHALHASHKAGIWNHLMFMIGHPGETPRDIIKLLSFIAKHRNLFKSAGAARFLLSRIDRLTENHDYKSYYGTAKVQEKKVFGLNYHEYNVSFLFFKSWLVQCVLLMCGIKFIGIFSRHKERFERDQYFYGAFQQHSVAAKRLLTQNRDSCAL